MTAIALFNPNRPNLINKDIVKWVILTKIKIISFFSIYELLSEFNNTFIYIYFNGIYISNVGPNLNRSTNLPDLWTLWSVLAFWDNWRKNISSKTIPKSTVLSSKKYLISNISIELNSMFEKSFPYLKKIYFIDFIALKLIESHWRTRFSKKLHFNS